MGGRMRAAFRKKATLKLSCAGLFGALGLQSCVGPDFQLPASPVIAAFTPQPLPAGNSAGGKTQRFETSRALPAEWWELFHSAALNDVDRAGAAGQPHR